MKTKTYLLIGSPGCLSGDTVLPVSREMYTKGVVYYTLRAFYLRYNNLSHFQFQSWSHDIETQILSLKNGVFQGIDYHPISDVVSSGIKTTYSISTKDDTLRATEDHKFLHADGVFVSLKDLRVGDQVVCRCTERYLSSGYQKAVIKDIVAIEEYEREETYDISMQDPYHNFVAHNFIVHNSGKTTATCTCEHPTLIIDTDCKAEKMENIKHLIKSGDVDVHPVKIPLVADSFRNRALHPDGKIKKQPEGYLYVVDLLNRILDNDEEFAKYNTIVLDSLTRLVEHMKRLLIYLRGQGKFGKRSDGDMNWPSWGSYLSNLEELFTQVVQMDKNFICTAHEKLETEHDDFTDTDTILGHWPMVDGQFMKKMSGYFDECYFMSMSITKAKGAVYQFHTRGSRFCARTSLNLNEYTPANIGHLWKLHNKNKKAAISQLNLKKEK